MSFKRDFHDLQKYKILGQIGKNVVKDFRKVADDTVFYVDGIFCYWY